MTFELNLHWDKGVPLHFVGCRVSILYKYHNLQGCYLRLWLSKVPREALAVPSCLQQQDKRLWGTSEGEYPFLGGTWSQLPIDEINLHLGEISG